MRFETCCFGYGLVEAPRPTDDGGCLFSDALGGGVHRWQPDGTVSTIVPKRRGVGGMVPHAAGGLVLSDAVGRVYVGSLRSPALDDGGPRIPGALHRIELDGTGSVFYDDVAFANGVGFAPDERVVYQSNYSAREVLAHDVVDGRATRRRVFATPPRGNPDGLAVDELGCVWVACGSGRGLARFTPDGRLDAFVDVPAPFVASLCFGGDDRRTLFVATMGNAEDETRGGTLFRTRVEVAGLRVAPARV